MSEKKPSILSFRGFRNLWVGQVISQFGDQMYGLVFLWLVLEVTKNPTTVGIVGACSASPYIFFSLYAGALADRIDRKLLLLWSDILSAILVFGFAGLIAFDQSPHIWTICAFAFALGTANVVAAPARSAIIPRLVPEDRLQDAMSMNSMSQGAMPLLGSLLTAAILTPLFKLSSLLAYLLTFGINGLTFVISALFMRALPTVIAERDDLAKNAWQDTKEGIRYLFAHPLLLPVAFVTFGIILCIAPFMPAYVVAAQQQYNGSPGLLGFLETGFFAGVVLGSLLAMRFKSKRPGVAFAVWFAICAVPIIPMGYVAYLGTAYWVKIAVFWLLNFACGIAMPLGQIPLQTLLQAQTEDAFRGRVNSAIGMINGIVWPLGTAISGYLISVLGLPNLFALMGVGLLLCALSGLLFPSMRNATLPIEEDLNASISSE